MQEKISVATVFGTRPEAIKMVPVILKLEGDPRFQVINIITAQHRQMLDQVLGFFQIRPDHDLSIMTHNQDLSQIVANSICRLDQLLRNLKPDVVLVQGDTSTTFVASLSAFYNRIRVGHVEAGLRTQDRYQPFPEEINRRLTTVVTDFHFAPTYLSKKNLVAEGVDPRKIMITGNTVVDAFQLALQVQGRPRRFALPWNFKDKKIILVTAHRRENFGAPMRSICSAIREIVRIHPDVAVLFPVHFNPKVREEVFPILDGIDRILLTDPLEYIDTALMIRRSTLVLTDSGGIQEEAPSLGRPVLVMRNTTERPEGVHAGTAKLVGTNSSTIIREVSKLLTDPHRYAGMANAINPYGDGRASGRIAGYLLHAFGLEKRRPRPFYPRRPRSD